MGACVRTGIIDEAEIVRRLVTMEDIGSLSTVVKLALTLLLEGRSQCFG
jgi:hypothetical protein